MTDDQILDAWQRASSGLPESRRNIAMTLLMQDEEAYRALKERFGDLVSAGRLIRRGSYRHGDAKYVVTTEQDREIVTAIAEGLR